MCAVSQSPILFKANREIVNDEILKKIHHKHIDIIENRDTNTGHRNEIAH